MKNPILFCVLVIIAILSVASGAKASDFLSDGDCYIDPVSGRQVCPLKKAAAATGKVLQAAANVVTPDCICGPNCQCNAGGTPCECPRVGHAASQSMVVESHSVSGWSKSWHKVQGQPIRNIGRRIFGK